MSTYHIRVVCVGTNLGTDEWRASIVQAEDTGNSAVVGPYPTKEQAKTAAEEYARESARRVALGELYDYDAAEVPA